MKLCCRRAVNLAMRGRWNRSIHGTASEGGGSKEKEGGAEHSTDAVDKGIVRKVMKEFSASDTVRNVAREHLLTGSAYSKALKSFKAYLLSYNHQQQLPEMVHRVIHGQGHVDDLCPYFLEHARHRNPLVGPVLELTHTSNLSQPTKWYPWSRALDRRIFYHSGPTNSGKTHKAMEYFKSAQSGIYCAPLRMLAHEIFHRCNSEGIACDLHTGEEVQFASGDEDRPAHHLACTVEMAHLSQTHVYDVAVIDEVQMIEDLQRGGAWTRALLGLPAKEVHVCGHFCAIRLVQRLAAIMEERFQVTHYKRLVPLMLEEESLASNYRSVRRGDCVIVFSRRQVFETRRRIESATGQKCAVVYGSLPPITRVQQAQLFNDPLSGCDIMVATDAVGMGLNLNIKRVVFHSLEKFDGEELRVLTSAHAKQIAGRAGRYGMDHVHGAVTTFYDEDLPTLHKLISDPVQEAKQAGLYPSPEQIKVFSSHLPHAKLPDILKMFAKMAQVDGNYFLCDMDGQMELASKLSSVSMPLMDHFHFSMAPVDVKKQSLVFALQKFAEMHASGSPVTFSKLKKILGLSGRPKVALSVEKLAQLEEQHDITDLYLWLGMRYPDSFTDEERVSQLQLALEEAIGESLLSAKLHVKDRNAHSLPRNLTELQRLIEHGRGRGLTREQKKFILAHSLREKRRKKVHRKKKKRH